MRKTFDRGCRCRWALAAVLVLGFSDVGHAGGPVAPHGQVRLAAYPRGRGNYRIPKPTNVDSSPIIDDLKKALKALGATDRSYEGHREKAVEHVGVAVRLLAMPNAKGRDNAAIEQAAQGKSAGKAPATSEADSEASLRKARKVLFSVHHQLADHAATGGRIRADAQVRTALQEIDLALKAGKPAPNQGTAPGTAAGAPSGKAGASR